MAYTLVPTELIVDGAITSAKLDTNIAVSGTLSVTGVTTLATHLVMGDNDKIKIGTGGDLEIYHDGSNSYISNSTGNIYLGDTNGSVHIQAKLNEESIVAAADGAVSLYHDNAVKLSTASAGVTVTGNATFADNGKAIFGAGSDLQIYHDGSNSIISDEGTGGIKIFTAGVSTSGFYKIGGEELATFEPDGPVTLYHNDVAKLATTSTGIDVTGIATMDGLTVESSTVNQNTASVKNTAGTGVNYGLEIRAGTNATDHALQVLNAAGTSMLRVTGGANVGIGTTSPARKLVVQNNAATSDNSSVSIVSGNAGFAQLLFGDSDTDTAGYIAYQHSNNSLQIAAGGSERIRITSAGLIGIGTTSPSNLLHAAGTGSTRLQIDATDNNAAGAGLFMKVLNSGSLVGNATVRVDNVGNMSFFNGTSSEAERLRIDASGNIGITAAASLRFNGASDNTHAVGYDSTVDGSFIRGQNGIRVLTGTGGGTERMRVTSAGVGIGIAPSSASGTNRLQIHHANNTAVLQLTNGGGGGTGANDGGQIRFDDNENMYVVNKEAGLLVLSTSNTDRLTIDASGNVGIGNTECSNRLHVTETGTGPQVALRLANEGTSVGDGPKIMFTSGTSTVGAAIASRGTALNEADLMFFAGGDTERMRLTNAGRLGIGDTAPTFKLEVLANAGAEGAVCGLKDVGNHGSGRDYIRFFNSSSAVAGRIEHTSSTGVTYVTSSDYRLKENIRPLENGLQRLQKLNPVKFDWIENKESSEGFIAHEVDEIFTEAVAGEKDAEEMQGMDYGRITPLLVKAIQEQQTVIDDLKSRIETLEG